MLSKIKEDFDEVVQQAKAILPNGDYRALPQGDKEEGNNKKMI